MGLIETMYILKRGRWIITLIQPRLVIMRFKQTKITDGAVRCRRTLHLWAYKKPKEPEAPSIRALVAGKTDLSVDFYLEMNE